MFEVCPQCSGEMEYICGITNMHMTGDEKDISIRRCSKCGDDYFFVSMDAWLSYGVNYFDFCICLTKEEAENLNNVIKTCSARGNKSCNCPAHGILDDFDYGNIERRIIIKDETDRYKDHDNYLR